MDCYVSMRSRGEEFFRLSPGSKTEDVSEYKRRVVNGAAWNASLHQTLHHSRAIIRLTSNHMQGQLAVHLEQMGLAKAITVKCLYVPSYSPKLNLVEYVIHLLRLRFLHHLPMGTTLGQIEQQLEQFLESNQFLSAEQVQRVRGCPHTQAKPVWGGIARRRNAVKSPINLSGHSDS